MVKPSQRRKTSSSNRSHEFFKVYLPDQSSQQLKIPPAFLKHFKGDLHCNSILKGPARRAWCVNVEKVDNNLYFKKGWQVFVEDNSLEFGDFLIFTYSYNGTSKFNVKIYGINGCKKEDATTAKQQRGIREDNQQLPCNEVKQENVGKFKKMRCKDSAFRRVTRQSSRSRVDMETKKKDRAPKEANKFSFKHPYFEIVMYSSYVNKGTMNVPASFMRNYMKKKRETITLQVSKRSWHVTLTSYENRSCKFSAGWISFVRENKLQEGTVCAFEVINTNDIVLKVSIRR